MLSAWLLRCEALRDLNQPRSQTVPLEVMRFLLILVLSLVLLTDILANDSHRVTSCLSKDVVDKRVMNLQRHFSVTGQRSEGAAKEPTCSEFSRTHFSPELHNRSLSPWRYISESVPDMIPNTYEKAECLCSGCVIDGKESTDYNSAPVKKTFMFLKKVPCQSDTQKYSLEIHYMKIAVACTCVLPKE